MGSLAMGLVSVLKEGGKAHACRWDGVNMRAGTRKRQGGARVEGLLGGAKDTISV